MRNDSNAGGAFIVCLSLKIKKGKTIRRTEIRKKIDLKLVKTEWRNEQIVNGAQLQFEHFANLVIILLEFRFLKFSWGFSH